MAEQLETGTFIDLHTHTKHSDGEYTVQQVVDRAISYGLGALAITDHDTVAAYIEDAATLRRAEAEHGLEIVPGIEISSNDEKERKYHILGLDIDPTSPTLHNFLKQVNTSRSEYAENICSLLEQTGWSIDTTELLAQSSTITKAHIARALLSRKENAKLWTGFTGTPLPTEGQLIEATLIKGKPYYISKANKTTPEQSIAIVHQAGGVAILAHPAFNIMHGEDMTELCERFKDMGIDGFEGTYIQHDRSNGDAVVEYRDQLAAFCENNDLLLTGGSDFHTDNTITLGEYIDIGFKNHPWKVPISLLADIKTRSNAIASLANSKF